MGLDPNDREQQRDEEVANSLSHAAGFLAALFASPALIADAAARDDATLLLGVGVFAASMLLLYAGSAIYHALPTGRIKHLFHLIERSAIFVLIAGTYTPFALSVLDGAWGWSLFGVVWGLAAAGIVLTFVGSARHRRLALLLYLGMGWLAVAVIRPLWIELPLAAFLWLLAGGLAYTLGVLFYAAQHVRFAHFIWHLFVLAGTACHFVAVRYAL